MKVALIDASLRPLQKGRRGGTLGKRFRPSVDLMKVFSFCRKEHIDARILEFREEMEDLSQYTTVVVSKGGPRSAVSPSIQLVMERLGWPKEGRKRLMDSLYDMHKGTDLCVIGRGMYPDGEAPRMGAEIDCMPADIDAYGEALYLRNRLDEQAETSKVRIIDLAYGRIMREDGTWSNPVQTALYSGSRRIVLDDADPASIPDEAMEGFMSMAASEGYLVHFRCPIDLERLSGKALDALCSVRWFGTVYIEGDLRKDRDAILRLAEACGPRRLTVLCEDYAKGVYKDEDHVKAIKGMLVGMYHAEKIGIPCAYKIAPEARAGRFGPIYDLIVRWRSAPRVYMPTTLNWYIRWSCQSMQEDGKDNARRREDIRYAYERLCEDPDIESLLKGFSGHAVRRMDYVYRGEE